MTNKTCDHKWVYKYANYHNEHSQGSYATEWHRNEEYYCEKCLEQKTLTKYECSRETPAWYKK